MTEANNDDGMCFSSHSATDHLTAAWGPLCISVAPVAHVDMLDEVADDLYAVARAAVEVGNQKWEQWRQATDEDLKAWRNVSSGGVSTACCWRGVT